MYLESTGTHKGVSVTHTARRAGGGTHPLVVVLRTLVHEITHLGPRHAHLGLSETHPHTLGFLKHIHTPWTFWNTSTHRGLSETHAHTLDFLKHIHTPWAFWNTRATSSKQPVTIKILHKRNKECFDASFLPKQVQNILSTKSLRPLIKYICNFWDLVLQWLIYEIT
jgi:hypothetical protein